MKPEGMVHALREAHRVLRPGGLLIDLRPAGEHRRVGVGEGRRWRQVGVMRESLDDDRSADRAVARAVRAGWFRAGRRQEFVIDRVMDGMDDVHQWIAEICQRRGWRSHAWLVRRVERALEGRSERIVGRNPGFLQALWRLD